MTHSVVEQAGALGLELLRLSLWLALLAAVFVPVERLFALHPKSIMRPAIWADLGFYFLNSLLSSFILGLPLAILATGVHQVMPVSFVEAVATSPLWVKLCAGMLVGEIGAYWGHRLTHSVPFLWQFHAVHHEAEHMDWLVNTRSHPVDMVFTRLCTLVPLYLLGLGGPAQLSSSTVPALVLVVGAVWGFLVHANVRWRFGLFEHLIASPAFHHWHHTKSGPIDRNFSSTLPWLDRVFGTYHLPKGHWPESYGVQTVEAVKSDRVPAQDVAHTS